MLKEKQKILLALPMLFAGQVMAQDKPNIVIIHTDEHNFRTLSCYRECLQNRQAFPWGETAVVETPNIDALARRGVLYTRCYATTPVSSPSRSSFMTGLYPQHSGVWTNDMELTRESPTFGEVLRDNGYATGYVGKLHLNGKGRPEWAPERDFGFTDHAYMYNRGHWKKIVDTPEGPVFRIKDKVNTTDSLTFTTDYLANRTIEFIDKHKNTPFCCMLCLPDPHSANLVRAPYDTMFGHLKFEQPATAGKDTTGLPAWSHGENLPVDRMEDMGQYFGMIKCIDDTVGRIIKTLSDAGVLDNTILVFTSDHGDMCGEHGLINKGVPLDASARIPFIISYPAGMRQGIRVESVMSVTDFAPSLLSFLGMDGSLKFDGRDLSPLWKGEALPVRYDDAVFMRGISPLLKSDWDESWMTKRTQWISVVTPDYKLTYSEYKRDVPWLTDLKADPDELVNRYNDPAYREVVKRLAQKLQEYGKQYNDPRVQEAKIQAELKLAIAQK